MAPNANANSHTPLDGVTVLDASRVLSGPFCTMQLGDLGAEVAEGILAPFVQIFFSFGDRHRRVSWRSHSSKQKGSSEKRRRAPRTESPKPLIHP